MPEHLPILVDVIRKPGNRQVHVELKDSEALIGKTRLPFSDMVYLGEYHERNWRDDMFSLSHRCFHSRYARLEVKSTGLVCPACKENFFVPKRVITVRNLVEYLRAGRKTHKKKNATIDECTVSRYRFSE